MRKVDGEMDLRSLQLQSCS